MIAKQYIRSKTKNISADTQGIEVEFICAEKSTNVACSKKLSSVNDKKMEEVNNDITSTLESGLLPKAEETSPLAENDTSELDKLPFFGFEAIEVESANNYHLTLHQLASNTLKDRSNKPIGTLQSNFNGSIENTQSSKPFNRKRKNDINGDLKPAAVKDNEMILANVFISETRTGS